LLSNLSQVQPPTIADINSRTGPLYDVAAKIADMCTITPQDVAMGHAARKNTYCSLIPKLVIGNYLASEVSEEEHVEDMEDTGCKDLPLKEGTTYFLFGLQLPEIPSIFEGGNICFAQALDSTLAPVPGSGALLFKPSLFVGNPIVKNINVPSRVWARPFRRPPGWLSISRWA